MSIHETGQGWVLETATTGYALGLNAAGRLVHRYWGPRLPLPRDYPPAPDPAAWASFNGAAHLTAQEYPTDGGTTYTEPCLSLTFADGVRDLVLAFERAERVDDPLPVLHLHLRDVYYPLRLTLSYRLHEAVDLIERWATVANDGAAAVTLRRVLSAQWHLPYGDDYRLTHLTGRWLDEWHLRQEALTQGVKRLESRRLTTSHHHNPWFAVDRGLTDEDSGPLWFGALSWSGNWLLCAEVTDFSSTRLSIGLNDWDFSWRLDGGSSFRTPGAVAGYTDEGFGGASRRLHDHIRAALPHGEAPRKVLYNSWEATTFAVDEPSQVRLAEAAAALGVELFVMDDGWFHGRNSDTAGLGDWWPDEVKFPQGLAPLIERVNALGMDFGLWLEPEMVNPDSDLYRAHPDWVIHFPTRARTEARNQLILNLARPEVQEYLIDLLDRLLSTHTIAFIKWDMNRNVSEPGWTDAPGEPQELWVRYVQGLYRVWSTLHERHPQVVWQSCSGGGGRADLAILRLADQVWVSDNTEPTARLAMQAGYSQLFPAITMEAWVTDMGPSWLPLSFRFHVSMCGVLGVGVDLLRWSPEEQAEATRWIALYKELRPTIQTGDQYRLCPPPVNAVFAVQYVSKDRATGVLFAFRTHLPEPTAYPPLYLRGLDPTAAYEVEGVEGLRSGAAWMAAGLRIELRNFESTVRRIWRRD